ncbi:MAG: ABC transporter permease [Bacteroidota bacterium]|nr:ABC transporter permease [Bacteroidota bacterium]
MFDLDKWYEIYHSIVKHKLRTVLTSFGVFWGILMLVLLLGAGKGLENGIRNAFAGYSNKSFYMGSNKTSIVYKGMKIGRTIEPTIYDLKVIKKSFPEIEAISPKQGLWGENSITYKTKNASFNVQGIYPDWKKIEDIIIIEGRYINDIDIKENRKVVVIGLHVKDFFFGKDESAIGKYLNIKGVFFKIVGVMKPIKSGWSAKEEIQTLWMPYTTMQVTFNQQNKVYFWGSVVTKEANSENVIKQVRSLLAQKHSFDANDDKAVWSWSMETESNMFNGLFGAINLFVWVVGIGTIIAGIVGVSNIMLISVKERTKEIGLRKALGATTSSIVFLVVQEAIILTTISGYSGLLIGVGIIEGINLLLNNALEPNPFFQRPEVQFSVAISALILLVISGTLAGLIPAVHAAKISPIEALRDE